MHRWHALIETELGHAEVRWHQGKDLASVEFLPVKCFKPSSQLEDLIEVRRQSPGSLQGWWACSHAHPGCPTRETPPAAGRQLHLLTYGGSRLNITHGTS